MLTHPVMTTDSADSTARIFGEAAISCAATVASLVTKALASVLVTLAPLVGFAERQYIAGVLVSVSSNAVAWIIDPRHFKPATAMPRVGVPSADALDIAAYLYTSGDPKRIESLQRPAELHR